MQFANTITIARRPAEVFAYLAHFENVPLWNYAISDTRKTSSGPVGVGSRYRQTRTLPTRSEEAFEVTEFEPDRRLSIKGRSDDRACQACDGDRAGEEHEQQPVGQMALRRLGTAVTMFISHVNSSNQNPASPGRIAWALGVSSAVASM